MSLTRAVVIVLVLAIGSAATVAFVSRTPAQVRRAAPGRAANSPSLGADFKPGDVARHAAYRGPGYLAFLLGIALQATLLTVLTRGPFGRLVELVQRLPGDWVVHAATLAVLVVAVATAVALPLDYVRGYAIQHAWQLSTQSLGSWFADQGRSLLIGAVTAAVTAVAFFGVVRWQPRTWWVWGWAVFTALTALLVFIYPVVIAPLFNKFTPLGEDGLKERVERLADTAGVDIAEVLVADASRRTTAENAYVAGLGSTKRLVLYDTLLRSGSDDETILVVAHELGHRMEGHLWKNVALSSVGLLAGFGALAFLVRQAGVWAWAGASGVADLRAIPVLLLFALLAGLVVLPIENSISRSFEARADAIAVELSGTPGTAVRVFRRLGYANLADLKPPTPLVWALFTHPSIPDRIEAVLTRSPGRT
ncbi:MAG: M48 family metallopeptidase [Actinomycetota bacterium]|nr:M48 family metallopeptidase [Actinomycetota bacterium]